MANSSKLKSMENLDNSIDTLLHDVDKKDLKKRKEIEEIRKKVAEVNTVTNGVTKSNNAIEFLTQIALNDKYKNSRGSEFKGNKLKKQTTDSINKLLEQNNISAFLTEERDRIERYRDYRVIDAYIPQVSRCIDLYRDSILSPDDITKNSLNIDYSDENISEDSKNKIEQNIRELKEKFRINKKAKQWLRDGLVDGDTFVAVLKIDEEINKMLLKETHSSAELLPNMEEENILTESEVFNYTSKEMTILNDILTEEAKETRIGKDEQGRFSLEDIKKNITTSINNNIVYVDQPLKNLDTFKNSEEINKKFKGVKMLGSIDKQLEPEKTFKLDIDGVCLGYLYIEKFDVDAETGSEGFGLTAAELSDTCTCGISSGDYFNSAVSRGNKSLKHKLLTDIFVKGISKKIDKKIIEKNQQFKELVYQLIKQDYLLDKKVKITYYEPEQVVHYKNDSEDVYGISKLSKIMFFAKIFFATMLTEAMQKISRGRDKRVIYVETGLDEDIEGSIQSVVRDIKSKDIQADDLKTITNILRQVGAFEDYFIPKIDGEVPIDFETISGMDVNVDDDFLQYLLKSIISGIGVPATYTDASNEVDFSRSLVMQNTTFVREIVSKQGDAQEFFTNIVRKMYMNEFGDEDIIGFNIEKINVVLPVPEYLNINNISEQISNHSNTIEFILGTYFDTNGTGGDDDKLKQVFKRELTKDFISSIDWDNCDNILDRCKMLINKEKLEDEADNNNQDDDMDLGDDTGDSGW